MYVNIYKSLISVSQIYVQEKVLKYNDTKSWLYNGLEGMNRVEIRLS